MHLLLVLFLSPVNRSLRFRRLIETHFQLNTSLFFLFDIQCVAFLFKSQSNFTSDYINCNLGLGEKLSSASTFSAPIARNLDELLQANTD